MLLQTKPKGLTVGGGGYCFQLRLMAAGERVAEGRKWKLQMDSEELFPSSQNKLFCSLTNI